MRRRIYVDPKGPLSDVTTRPTAYMDDEPWERASWCRTGALRDEDLWARYQAALDETLRLECEIERALRYEPLDEVERRAAERMEAMLGGGQYDGDEWDRLEVELLENARSR